jgi:hypothetical protein
LKKITLLAVWFCCAVFAKGATTPNPADYTETLHVTYSYLEASGGAVPTQRLDVTTNGKKYSLAGTALIATVHGIGGIHPGVLPIGDYKAKLIPNDYKPDYVLFLTYEILLPDGKTIKFAVIGQTE